ncbi:MerR family transcriptional regulator [Promicromonospora iranensis]|uniref:MerR family transcriptional regulator n=1 Tax=Promicromonospora iranensis TaxID=1105144 RepID=UPI0023AA109B|nr:MerR family transcriptional regulator [Promicromonospora iranensis]
MTSEAQGEHEARDMENTTMRIGELAARAGVSVRALRYYEEQGLLASERSPAGQRYYAEDAVDRVRLIQLLYSAGLNSKAVSNIMPCMDSGMASADMLELLAAERDRIDERLHELAETRDRLTTVIELSRATRRRPPRSAGTARPGGPSAPAAHAR